MHSPSSTDDCAGCPIGPDRRAFLHQTAALVGGIFAVHGSTHVYTIPDKDGVQIDKDNSVILVRWLGSVYAFSLSCPHQNTALTWLDKEERFQCPKHRSQYSADGYFIRGRATRGMDRYAISVDTEKKTVAVDSHTPRRLPGASAGWRNRTHRW